MASDSFRRLSRRERCLDGAEALEIEGGSEDDDVGGVSETRT
jgi:hypothetical protein